MEFTERVRTLQINEPAAAHTYPFSMISPRPFANRHGVAKLHEMPFMSVRSLILFAFLFAGLQAAAQDKPSVSLNHIAVYVTDLAKSTGFYKDIVGLDTIPEPFHDGRHTWFSVGPKAHLHLISGATRAAEHDKNGHLCFTVQSVDQFIKKLEAAQVPYEDWAGKSSSVTLRVDGVKQIYFKDPDGYWLEINDARQ